MAEDLPELEAFADRLPRDHEGAVLMACAIGFLAGRIARLKGSRAAAQLLYALADAAAVDAVEAER